MSNREKYFEEFEKYADEHREGVSYREEWKAYLTACEKRDKEIEDLKEQLNNSMNFHCPHFKCTDNGYVACELDKPKKAEQTNPLDFAEA